MKNWWFKRIFGGILIVLAVAALLSFVVMNLWNALIPDLFHGPIITFWQSLGLLVLSHILLRSWGPGRHAHGWRSHRWQKHLEEKLASMTPEEREKFKERLRNRCGYSVHEEQKT